MYEETFQINYVNDSDFFKRNELITNFLFMRKIKSTDFIAYDNIKDDLFFHYIDYLSTLSHIEAPCDFNNYLNYIYNVVDNLATASKYVFANDYERLLVIYALACKTYCSQSDEYVDSIINDDIVEILKISKNSNLRIYCMYIVCNTLINRINKLKDKNISLFINLISTIINIRQQYNDIEKCVSLLINKET